DALGGGGALQACADLFTESVFGSLSGVAESIEFLPEGPQAGLVEILTNFFNHAAFFERVEETERHALGQAAAFRDFAKGECFAGASKGKQKLGGVHDGLHEIRIANTWSVAVHRHQSI